MKKDDWLLSLQSKIPNYQSELLAKAFDFATDNESFPIGQEIADILLPLQLDSETIAAALVYPRVHREKTGTEKLDEILGSSVRKLIQGVMRMEAISEMRHFTQTKPSSKQIENLRKLLLAMVDDVRIVLIKLAEQMVTLKHISHLPADEQHEIANQTLHIYAPLANRLGVGQMKSQIEDLSFQHLHPEEFKQIKIELEKQSKNREAFIQKMTSLLKNLFKDESIELTIKGRSKHIYSIYKKMLKKRVNFNEIFDTLAFRIIVPTIKDCYSVLGVVHSSWDHIAKEFDDYIAKPKLNGYQSIHTVVLGPDNVHVEIQIRTQKMDEEAELGVAAHWKYKEGNQEKYSEKINWLREIMHWQKEITSEKPGGKDLYSKIFSKRIYVFTPQGEIFDLPQGATPLDFAYHIHSDIGNHCRGAKVNETLAPLSHALKTGDRVTILTDKKHHPSLDWLNPHLGYLTTSLAKNKVRHWFRKENYQENLRAGQALWEKTMQREGLNKSHLSKIYADFNLKSVEDLLASIGAGDLTMHTILQHLKSAHKETPKEQEFVPSTPALAVQKQIPSHFNVSGIKNLLTQLARCCKPIPGDAVLGYITKGRGITIHQITCANLKRAKIQSPERVVEVNWGSEKLTTYPVGFIVEAEDRPGLIRDITNIIASENITIIATNSRIDKKSNTAYINLTVQISDLEPLKRIFNQIRSIPQIINVNRQ